MKKSKYKIYAFSPRKKLLLPFFICIAFMVFIVGVKITPKPGGKAFDLIMKKSITSVFFEVKATEKPEPAANKIKIHNIMNMLSPVFANSEKSVFLNTDRSVQVQAVELKNDNASEAKKITEKSVVSKDFEIKNETEYTVDAATLWQTPRQYKTKGDTPKVLIIHTHACETYSGKSGTGLGDNGEYRTTDANKNMIKIGEIIANVFKENGINVLHDKTLCDYPAYNSSYVKSLEVIENYLLKYPEIEFVFDIHRDAIADKDGNPTKLTCKINGDVVSQAMIVCGTDAMGLENPNWQENLILALKIQKNLEQKYPGFMRPINLRKERFNMHKTKGSLLFEVGTHGNTIEEAEKAAKYLALGIAETIK